jgi:molybdopterin-guanine dinucleotide biosynthesis protein A
MLAPVSDRERQPIGVILAGGEGRRIGGDKAIARLAGTPLMAYPLQAMRAVVRDLAVVAKPDTRLPELSGVAIWIEPAQPRHPLVGILHALREAAGRPVLVCAADMPLITADALTTLATADAGCAPAVIATSEEALQPLLGLYLPAAAALLADAAGAWDRPLRAVVSAIGPRLLELQDPRLAFNVNTPDDLAVAEQWLNRR